MSLVTAVTATGSSAQAVPARPRQYLGIFNQSTTATVSIAFDAAATAAATAGQVTLLPVSGANKSSQEWSGQGVPTGAVNVIASAGGTPVTVIEDF